MPPQASLSPTHRVRKTYARRNELGIHGDEFGMACIALSAIVDQSHREEEHAKYMRLRSLYEGAVDRSPKTSGGSLLVGNQEVGIVVEEILTAPPGHADRPVSKQYHLHIQEESSVTQLVVVTHLSNEFHIYNGPFKGNPSILVGWP